MRRTWIFFILGCFFIIINPIIPAQITGESVTGEAVTGEVTVQSMALNISVISTPSLTLISPENETYITNKNLLLNYSASGEDYIWYNLDNGANTTISSATYFNTTNVLHTLYLYANNSQGITTQNVTFTIDTSLLNISYEKYNGSTKGNSTNFNIYPYEELQNLSNIILEHTTYGKILFLENINMTDDYNSSDGILDLDSYTNITLNNIGLNSNTLPNFNKPATIWMYNLAFSNPRILKDDVICPSSICTLKSYSGGTLEFNVTGFGIYSVEETPVTETETITVGGGGGSTRIEAEKKDFSVDRESIKISLKQGETKKETIKIKNIGKETIKINLENPKLEKFLKISETEFELKPKEEKIITLDFLAREDTIPNLYLGSILIKKATLEEKILIAIEVESREALFDIKTEIPRKFLYVLPGEDLLAEIELYNLGEMGKVDAHLEYIIKNEQEEVIISEQDTLAVETRTNFIKTFKIPKDTEFGKYIFYVKVTYEGKVASASAWFNVGKKSPLDIKTALIGILILIMIMIIIIYRIKHIKKRLNLNYNLQN
ncbi:hypothetical protein KAT80_01260 [Candidatus Pacearchaeota archaeon]|nr:hypothetical protein [Candidatus Pacearchaeota archaeon]